MEKELIELAIAVVVIALVLFVLRRASAKSRERAPASIKERLGVEEAEAKPKRRPAEKAAAAEEKAPEAAPPAAPSEDEVAAYKAGLAKTRGGFVARIGKLFGKKQIDAQTLDELEEVLFTADIGPRAAERIFTSVKSG